MRSFALVAAIFATVLAVLVSAADNSWEYLLLVNRWPGSACLGLAECSIPSTINHFTLHGMWPSRDTDEGPASCNPGLPFNPDEISSLMSDMHLYWTDFTSPTSTSFWEHEWDKHGTCAMTDSLMSTELSYFTAALNLRKSMDLVSTLNTVGIVPSAASLYQAREMVAAIKTEYGVDVVVTCLTHNEVKVLVDFRFCVDNQLRLINCDSHVLSAQDNCVNEDQVSFPPIVHT